ncbi:MAG: arginine--tRNA ligase [Actinomycetota bacterium]|nr:arginine--tRNA ligase [Actinomycetota bacterium]
MSVPERELIRLVREAVARAGPELGVDLMPEPIEISRPRRSEHGDFATNVALALAGPASRSPREVADVIVRYLPESELVAKVDVAGPGFINFFVTHGWLYTVLQEILSEGDAYGRLETEDPGRVQVEFVSTNPTGPLHVGHARNAVVGDALCRLLETAGYPVQREYYVNDAGSQALLFGASVEARYLEHHGRPGQIPEGGYQGEYIKELAATIAAEHGDALLELPPDERPWRLAQEGMRIALEGIRASLERFGIRFDEWFRESWLRERGEVDQAVGILRDAGLAYEQDGAIWFRATRYGDEKDRVLIRANGEPTYFAADCAYLRAKFERGFDRLVYVWGADHHGTVKRLRGAVEAFGFDPDTVEFILTQLVALYRGGEPARMSKRTGDLVTLDELLDEVGPDAARYTLLSRSVDSPLDFDIDLVKRHTLDNPVYYVQYAHARIASLLRYAVEQGRVRGPFSPTAAAPLVHETELDLLRSLAEFPEQVRVAADLRAPYRLTKYTEDVAAAFHRFYTECRVVTEDEDLTQARLHVSEGTRQVIANALGIIGVSAPESMERLEEDEAS